MPDDPADREDVVLIIRPVRDPLAGPGRPPRDAAYRLKLLLKRILRDHGFRAVAVRNPTTDEAAACGRHTVSGDTGDTPGQPP